MPGHKTPDPDLLRQVLARTIAGRRPGVADLFAERRNTLRIDLLDGQVARITNGLEEGAAVRTLGATSGRFRYCDGLGEASLHELTGSGSGHQTTAEPGLEATAAGPVGPLLGALEVISTEALRDEPRCRRVEVSCFGFRQQVWVVDETGRLAGDQRTAFRVSVALRVGDARGSSLYGRRWSDSPLSHERARWLARRAVASARAAAEARPCPAGPQAVVLAGGSGGILVHEACGHPLEADYVLGGHSPFAGRLGQSVASPLVTAVDDPTRAGLSASLTVDDEGVPAQRKLLIHKGVLTAFLCGRREAAAGSSGFDPGNGRRRSFRHPPLARMSNTMILAGETPPEEIIRCTEKGIFAARLSAGQADPASGRFRFTVAEGSLIEQGKLTAPLDGAVISGDGPAALAAVDLVGTDAFVDPTAAGCTKAGQTIPVSLGHPTLRISSLMVEPLSPGRGIA